MLAGGSGRRLRPLTHTGAKQLVPVANRPILFYAIDNLVDAGVRDIAVVISPETGSEVCRALGDGSRFGAKLEYISQAKPAGLAHALRHAKEFVGDDDVCMFLGDNLIGTKIAPAAAIFRDDRRAAALVLLKEVDDPSAFGVAVVDAVGRVKALVEKPASPPSNLALVGIYFFRPKIFAAIDAIRPSARGELEITDAIARLVDDGELVRSSRVTSWWLDTGKKDDLLLANLTVLDDWLEHDVRGDIHESSISGRVRIAEGAVVRGSTVRGPVVIGAGARVIDAHIGPFTSIGEGAFVERSSVENSVLMEESRVLDVPRLQDSIVGRRAMVCAAGKHQSGLCLMVGDDCKVEAGT